MLLTVFGTATHALTSLLHIIAAAICILIAWALMMTGFGPEKIDCHQDAFNM